MDILYDSVRHAVLFLGRYFLPSLLIRDKGEAVRVRTMTAEEIQHIENTTSSNVDLPNGQRWEIDSTEDGVLGRGRFGVVRRCVLLDDDDDTVGACKSVYKPFYDGFDSECLDNEVKILEYLCASTSSHPGLVRIYGVSEESEWTHIVMEICTGGDLFDRIVDNNARGSVFPESEAAEIMRQILESLVHCHAAGVAHRDIKPDNVMFVDGVSNRVKIADFGQAAVFGGDVPMQGVVGTPYYVAPEVLEGGEYTEKVDVWSAGIVLYTMLCGCPPFRGESPQEVFCNVIRGRLCFRPHLSASVKSLLRLMLHRNPSSRPSAAQVLEHPWFART